MKYDSGAYYANIEIIINKRKINSSGTIQLPGGENLPALGIRGLAHAII